MRALALLVLLGFVQAPDPNLARVMTTVRAAMKPALPFPASDESGNMPVVENPKDEWMIRPPQDGDNAIEVLANPVNPEYQARAAKAMKQIEESIEAAQRKADAQYERAIAEARRTGKSQAVDGVTLSDEGIAGARVDADSHFTVEVEFNKTSYQYAVRSSLEPAAVAGSSVPGAVTTLSVPAHVYRDKTDDPNADRYCVAETQIFFGAIAPPQIKRRTNAVYDVTAAETPATGPASEALRSLVVRMRGNEKLMSDVLKSTDWAQIVALVRQRN